MKTKHWIVATSVAVAVVFLTPRVISQDEGAPFGGGGLTPERLDELSERNNPGPEHEVLASLAGDWTTKSRYFMSAGEAMLAEGTAKNEMILGGRFLQSTTKSRGGPVKLERVNMFGFDRRLEEYTLASFDTWGTQFLTAIGYMNEAGDEIAVEGQDFDPGMGTVASFKILIKLNGPDEFVLEYWENPTASAPSLRVETVHTRVKN